MIARFSLCLLLSFTLACSSPQRKLEGGSAAGTAAAETTLVSKWNGSIASVKNGLYMPNIGIKGMVNSDDPVASALGANILKRGGNAIDAAVAVAFALAVTRPHYAGIGGGGFLVFCPAALPRAPKPTCHALDYREAAPLAATPQMYEKDGKLKPELATSGPLASVNDTPYHRYLERQFRHLRNTTLRKGSIRR